MDYAFRLYGDFKEIKDKKFHKLRKAYVKAAQELSDYIGWDDGEPEDDNVDDAGYYIRCTLCGAEMDEDGGGCPYGCLEEDEN